MSEPPPDPTVRRLAARRAAKLGEAGRLLRALEALLQSAEFDTAQCTDLAQRVATAEQCELLRSAGRIESRRRFKFPSGDPLRDNSRSPGFLFIDECGRSNPQPHIANDIFALGAIAMSADHIADYRLAADAIKRHFFGRTDITFHEPDMRRADGRYYFEDDRHQQRAFQQALNELVEATPFVAFGCGIRKAAFEAEFRSAGIDPYLPTDVYSVAIMLTLERYVDYICVGEQGLRGRVVFESQGPKEDALHQLEYARLLIDGTQWVPQSAFQQAIEPGAQFVPKMGSHPMELADMLSREIWEWVRDGCGAPVNRFALFGAKTYKRGDGERGKFGIKVFPDSDIRPQIEAHRDLSPSRY